jgi:hypothetical protein
MPIMAKGKRILAAMRKTYKKKGKAESVFYAMINSGKIKGAEKGR